MKTTLNVLFKKMQKDDKKEVLLFHMMGDELPHAQALVELAGGIVVMDIEGCDAGEIMAEFASLQRDSKKTALKFNVKGDSEEKAIELYPFAGRNVTLNLQASQMSIDDYYGEEPHDGIEYRVNPDGTVDADPNQVTIDEAAVSAEKVSDLEMERKKRGRKKKDEAPGPLPFADDDDDELPI